MKSTEASENLKKILALFVEHANKEMEPDNDELNPEIRLHTTTDRLNEEWKNKVLLQDNHHVVSFDILDTSKDESDLDAHEQAILCSWKSDRENNVYHLKYLENGGRFSPRILTVNKEEDIDLETLLQRILSRTDDGILLKKESIEEQRQIYAIRVFDIRNEVIPLAEVLLFEAFVQRKRNP